MKITTKTKLFQLKQIILKTLKKITHIGTTKKQNPQEKSRIILSNTVILSAITIIIPFGWYYLLTGYSTLGYGLILLSVLYNSVFILNKHHFYNTAKIASTTIATLAFSIFFIFLGPKSGIHFSLFPVATVSLLLYHPKQKKHIYCSIITPIILFILVELFGSDLPLQIIYSETFLMYQNIICILISFIFVFFSFKLYISQQLNLYNYELKNQSIIEIQLLQAIKEIDSKNITLEQYSSKDTYIEMTKNIAHEIRNPMSILLSGANLLKNNIYKDQKSAIKFANIMINTIGKLEKLTSTLLKQNKPITDESSIFYMHTLCDEITTLADLQCKQENIKLTSHMQDSQSKIYGNQAFISQALLNIIINAIQHCQKNGHIDLTLKHKNKKEIQIIISDNGKGIPKDKLPLIFNKHITSEKNKHNSGLGLTFVKRVIDEHNATIEVESKIGKGSKFILTWPIYKQQQVSLNKTS